MGLRVRDGLLALSGLLRRLGNPLRTEAAAFRWLFVLAGAFAVVLVVVLAARALL